MAPKTTIGPAFLKELMKRIDDTDAFGDVLGNLLKLARVHLEMYKNKPDSEHWRVVCEKLDEAERAIRQTAFAPPASPKAN
jgi:hypothetical protein